MPELLLELFSEEIPARMQRRAATDLAHLLAEKLKAARLSFEEVDTYVTPRRLTAHVTGLPAAQPDLREERRGPRADAPEKAIDGFKASLPEGAELEERETERGTFLFATVERRGRPADTVLAEVLPEVIRDFPWPKSMRWGAGDLRWVRPLHAIICRLDGTVVPVQVDGIHAGSETRGHRFLAPAVFEVTGFDDYAEKLRGAYVLLDPEARQEKILSEARALAADAGLDLVEDWRVLEENVGLTEWPVALLGSFDAAYLAVPSEVLMATMEKNQKYFPLRRRGGELANRFVCIANLAADDGGAAIIRGNERVLSARLADAKFFWDQDRKAGMEDDWLPQLAEIVFHEKLGSVADKTRRLEVLARSLAEFTGADGDKAARAARLAKADLVSGMVGEFPEVQGIMGGYYAAEQGEAKKVAAAIRDHYAPQGPDDDCPRAPVSIAVSLADKIDTLVGFFGIEERPTGSKDPYALRRAALGVIRLILENQIRLNLFDAFRRAYEAYEFGKIPLGEHEVALLDFFVERLKVQQRGKGVPHDLIDAVFSLAGDDDLVRLLARVDALRRFLGTEDGANLLAGYRRAANIVRIEENRDKCPYDGPVDPDLLTAPREKALFEKLAAAKGEVAAAIEIEDFTDAMRALAGLRAPVDSFFDHVTVNTEDPVLRENRLKLLNEIRAAVHTVADFSKIEG